jgi:hypothetical protein
LRIESEQWKIENVEIYDISGKKIYNTQLSTLNSIHLINVNHLPAGIYFLRLKTDEFQETQVFIKE